MKVSDQVENQKHLINDYIDKVEKDFRALKDEFKKKKSFSYTNLTHAQDDMAYLDRFMNYYTFLRTIDEAT